MAALSSPEKGVPQQKLKELTGAYLTDLSESCGGDESLIRKYCEEKDESAFRLIVSRYKPFIRKVLFGVFGKWDEEAEEAEQEVYISLMTSLCSYSFHAAFQTYLYRITRNKGIDQLRKRHRLREVRYFEIKNNEVLKYDPVHSQNEEREYLHEILEKLKEEERSLLLLKDIEGYSIHDISELMNMPEGTVKSKIHRARKRAAKLAEESGMTGIGITGGVHEMPGME